ncbi:MAG: reverse transcriptase/maturase family protein [Candidatus Berkelbacteria bacterium]|nr:reverse transcriptase/maturase family protein [Candidatus Berkelbacteria bacterium]MCR4307957.1 reverse transcriptase/maturase family protein [Candidatus Berkelbacteria bacterium]
MKIYSGLFESIISVENLFLAWEKFRKGKRNRKDVQEFEWLLEPNIFQLHRDLKNRRYKHGNYHTFYIQDPKQRLISKAAVRDRIVHQAIFNILNPIFEAGFIPTSFSCRIGKGTHRGVLAVDKMIRQVSRNYTQPGYVLKCDIKKFFRSVDHQTIIQTFARRIKDEDTIWLLGRVVESFPDGMPIGNLTSQLFANIYMNEFDQFVKQTLGVKNYARYTDDFIVVAQEKTYLSNLLEPVKEFLHQNLSLELHQNKVSIRKYQQGADFLGYVILPHRRQLRTKTKHRVLKNIDQRLREYKEGLISRYVLSQSLASYRSVLQHADTYKLTKKIQSRITTALTEL